MLGAGTFHPLDWLVLALYFLLLAASGVYFARRARVRGVEDYFLAARRMPVWAVAVSILATSQSAATFIGVPELSYSGDLTYLFTKAGALLAALLLAAVFIPAYYRLGVATPYQLLESRFGPGARLAASWAYMLGRVFSSGARVYIGALPVALAVFGDSSDAHLLLAIAAFMAFAVVYTLVGGISAVIWTDALQVAVYLGAALAAAAVLLWKIPASLPDLIAAWASPAPDAPSKLTVVQPAGDPFAPFTLLSCLTAFALLTVASHGTDQDLVQRMLTCKTGRRGASSVLWGVLVEIPVVALFLLIGLLLWAFYTRPDLMGAAAPPGEPPPGKDAFVRFILAAMPPGLAGLLMAGVLAAGPAGVNASLNAMAATFVTDVYRPARPGLPERHYLLVSRLAVVGWGVVLGAFAVACIWWTRASRLDLIGLAISVMTFAYAGLLGVFFVALFTRRGSARSAVAALAAGFVAVALFQPLAWDAWTGALARLVPACGALRDARPAVPWHLVAGAGVATLVCALGRPRGAGRTPADRGY